MDLKEKEAFLALSLRVFDQSAEHATEVLSEIIFRNKRLPLEAFRKLLWKKLKQSAGLQSGDHREALAACDLLFCLGYTLNEVETWLGIPKSSLRFRIPEIVDVELKGVELKNRISKDCVNFDLFLLDSLLGESWQDPLGLYKTQDFSEHQATCSRCKKRRQMFDAWIVSLKNKWKERDVRLEKLLEQNLVDLEENEGKLSFYLRIPWYARLALQLTGASLVLLSLLFVPYFGDYVPQDWKEKFSKELTNFKSKEGAQVLSENPPVETKVVEAEVGPPAEPKTEPETKISDAVPTAPMEKSQPLPPPVAPVPPTTIPKESKPKVEVVAKAPVVPAPAMKKDFVQMGAVAEDLDRSSLDVISILKVFKYEKAGEYEMGDAYKGGRYFHFILSAQDYPEFRKRLRALKFQSLSERKTQSPRQIRGDQERVVLWIGSAQP